MMRRLLILIAVIAIPLSLIAGPAVQAASAQGVSTAVVTPASGLAGSTVTGSGSNWTVGDHIQAYWSDDNSTLGGEVVVASDGTFTDPGLKIPTGATAGSHQILFSDVEGRYFETASFDVTGTSSAPPPPPSCSAPSVSLTPSAGPVGSQFVMKGAGWISGGVVHITLPNGSKGIFGAADATPTVSAGGAWQTTVTVGKSPAGSYTFTFAETGCTSQTGTFQVTASPAPTLPDLFTDKHLPACILSMVELALDLKVAEGVKGAVEAWDHALLALIATGNLVDFYGQLRTNHYWAALINAEVIDPLNDCLIGVQLLLNDTSGKAGIAVARWMEKNFRV
jgi:hypothetical protein